MSKGLIFFLVFCLCPFLRVEAQMDKSALFQEAYDYLSTQAIPKDKKKWRKFQQDCNQIVQRSDGKRIQYPKRLQVGTKYILPKRVFPFQDFVEHRYDPDSAMILALRMGRDIAFINDIIDSLGVFWKDYPQVDEEMMAQNLSGLPHHETGYLVFFSDVYKNTLAAEVKSFCASYEKSIWFGSSTSYFFIFDDLGAIKEVFSGVVIHYN